jgi:ubiquitin C-terminal hydrolase
VQEEDVEKDCEECGAVNSMHSLQHSISRLPRILVLHLKRFKVTRCAARRGSCLGGASSQRPGEEHMACPWRLTCIPIHL